MPYLTIHEIGFICRRGSDGDPIGTDLPFFAPPHPIQSKAEIVMLLFGMSACVYGKFKASDAPLRTPASDISTMEDSAFLPFKQDSNRSQFFAMYGMQSHDPSGYHAGGP